MDGRVKTLHPRLYAGLLAVRDDQAHVDAASEHDIEYVDLVCVNLYPFERAVSSRLPPAQIIESSNTVLVAPAARIARGVPDRPAPGGEPFDETGQSARSPLSCSHISSSASCHSAFEPSVVRVRVRVGEHRVEPVAAEQAAVAGPPGRVDGVAHPLQVRALELADGGHREVALRPVDHLVRHDAARPPP